MKISFFLDVKLTKINDKYYTTGAANYEYFNNHKINSQNELIIFCREEKIKNENNLSISSGENIEIITIKSYKELLNKATRKEIIKIINKTQIHIVKMPTIIGIFVCHLLKKYKKNYIIEMVGDPYDSLKYKGGIIPKLIAPIIKILNKYYIKNAKIVSYVSNEYLQKKYPTKGQKFAISDVLIAKNNEEIIKNRIQKINQQTSKIKIGLIGSLDVDYKGHLAAIKAINILKEKYPYIELHFLGKGNKERWENIINQNKLNSLVYFDGIRPHEIINEWFDDIDIYIIPSLTEGMPRSLIEAMSRGCQCIGTNVGGIPELLDKDMLIEKKAYKELASKIDLLLSNKKMMIKYSKRNIEKSNEFQIEKINKKKEKYYNEIMKEL
mgnify:CR=1 FL=1